jgi:pimeloyl-ACP methyl ester carboxylesterase
MSQWNNIMPRVVALVGTLVILSACKTIALHPRGEDGRCLNEDFVESVSGGRHCMFIKVEKPIQEFSEPPELIVTFHGDGGSHRQWERMFKNGRETFPKLNGKNYITVHFDRVGWGRSSGASNGNGWNSYQPDYIDATMEAIHRLKNHYKGPVG